MLPDLSVFWVIFFVLLLTVILDRLLFRPILRVIAEREKAITSARELADRSALEARNATAEFERRTTDARGEIYRQMDEMRRAALAERAGILASTRAEAETQIAAATAQLQAEVENARRTLSEEADALGTAAADRILGRKAAS